MSAPTDRHPPREDIRSQFTDIQRKLFPKKSERSLRATTGDNIPVHDDQENFAPFNNTITKKKSKHKTLAVMPMAGPTSTMGPESKGNDMNFVVGLSDNLLGECRRLNSENQKYKTKLRLYSEEIKQFKLQINQLKSSNSSQVNSESNLKDKNWELESNVVNLNEQVNNLSYSKEKLIKLHDDISIKYSTLQKENDDLLLKNHSLNKDYTNLKSTYAKEIADLSNRIEELNDENDQLHIKLSSSTPRKVQSETSTDMKSESEIDRAFNEDDDEYVDFDSLLAESHPSMIASMDSSNPQLELETLRANLHHSNRTIAKLRTAVLKLRRDDASIGVQKTPMKHPNLAAKRSKSRANTTQSSNRNSLNSPAKRGSKILVYDDETIDDDVLHGNQRWDDFIDEDIQATPSKHLNRVFNASLSDVEASPIRVLNDGKYLVDSSESEDESTPSETKRATISRELKNISDKEQIENYAASNNLVIISRDEFNHLQSGNVRDISDESLGNIAESKGYVLIKKKAYGELVDENVMKEKLLSKGLVTLPVNELSQIQKYADSYNNPSESYIISKCSQFKLHPFSDEEFNNYKSIVAEHDKPSQRYITDKANSLGLIVTSSAMYDEIKRLANEPTVDELISRAQNQGYSVIKNEDIENLKRHITPTLDQINAEAKSLGYEIVEQKRFKEISDRATSPSEDHLLACACKLAWTSGYCIKRIRYLKTIGS